MKTIKSMRKITFFMLTILLLSWVISPFSVYAVASDKESEVMPLANNVLVTNEYFVISSDGVATIRVEYTGYANITRSATVTVKIQKKVLFWWSDVDNGLEDNTWVIYMSGVSGTCTKTLALEDKGSYRAVIEYTITGSGGADDVLPATLYYDYE